MYHIEKEKKNYKPHSKTYFYIPPSNENKFNIFISKLFNQIFF